MPTTATARALDLNVAARASLHGVGLGDPMTSRRRLVAAVASCLALLAFTGTAPAAPIWSPPVSVVPGDNQAIDAPAAAYDGSGQLTLAWASDTGGVSTLPTARRPLGGPFAAGPALATVDGAAEPVLGRGPGGDVYAAWVVEDAGGSGIVMGAGLGPDGGVISPRRLTAPGENASEPAIAVGADGAVAVAWTSVDRSGRGQIRVLHGALGATPSQPRVASGGDANAGEPEVLFDHGGVLHVAWTRLDASDNGRIKEATALPGGAFAASRAISPSGAVASEPALATVPGPGIAFAWTEASEDSEAVRVRIEAPGVPETTQSVPGGGDSSDARLATDSAGTLYIAWIRTTGDQANVLVSARNATGGFDDAQVLSPGEAATKLDIAFSPQADAVVVWQRNLGDIDNPAGDIRAAVFDAPRAPNPVAPAPPDPPLPPPPPPAPAAPPPPPPSPPVAASSVLGLTGFGVSPGCISYGGPLAGARRRLGFTFALSEPATIVLTIRRRLNSSPFKHCPTRRPRGDRAGWVRRLCSSCPPARDRDRCRSERRAISSPHGRVRAPRRGCSSDGG